MNAAGAGALRYNCSYTASEMTIDTEHPVYRCANENAEKDCNGYSHGFMNTINYRYPLAGMGKLLLKRNIVSVILRHGTSEL